MKSARWALGYTIVEVVTALTLASLIFVSAMSVFNSQTGESAFSQTAQDFNSEITTRLKEVNTNVASFYAQYDCEKQSIGGKYRPLIQAGSPTANCVYLGKAIFVPVDPDHPTSTIYFYDVFGNRQKLDQFGTASSDATVFDDTNPITGKAAAVAALNGSNFVQSYTLRSATTAAAGNYHVKNL